MLVSLPSVVMLHGVDASRLAEVEAFGEIIRSPCVIGWQFPYNGEADDAAGNSALVRDFFQTISESYWSRERNDTPLLVFVTTQSEQAARWGLLRSAREAMFYLQDMMAFDVAELPGYVPKKTAAPLEKLELRRPTTFVFAPCRPVRFDVNDARRAEIDFVE